MIGSPVTSRVFFSAVSTEFRSYRLRIANQLAALKGRPFDVKVQEDFQQGAFTLLENLADYVRECDLVIHLVGDSAGARPSADHERALYRHLGETPPDSLPGWSYTQWEYRLARRFNKRMLVYIAQPESSRDCGVPVRQSDDDARLQQAHVAHIHNLGEHWTLFAGPHALVREVFRDLGLEPTLKVDNIRSRFQSLGSLFKGRDEFLERIRAALVRVEHRGHQRFAAITAAPAAAVHGLGGIGKTRAAVEFAIRHADEYTALLFVTADSPASLRQNLAALCGPMVLDLAEKDAREVEIQAAAVLRWLQQHPGWFLIFDNVDTEEAARAVEDLLGQLQSAGQVLVTSRISRWSGAVETLALDVLAEADAADFLLQRTNAGRRKAPDDETLARTLAVTLGQLALALEQAGAYIAEQGITFSRYLKEWQDEHDRVLEWFDERLMRYPMSVAVTWQTSFNQLSAAGRRLLHRLAWFAPDPIPESLLETPIPGTTDSEYDLRDALVNLAKYSLATRAAESPTFTVHRLVQDVTRRSLRDDTEHHPLTEALHWIDTAFEGDPGDVRTWPTLDPLAPHARAAADHADQAAIARPTARLMNVLGLLLKTKALHAEAEPLYRRALAIDEHSFGDQHPEVAADLNNLALLLQDTNRLAEAEPLMRRALAINEQSFGDEHAKVAILLNNLAWLLKDTNRLAEAEPLMRRALGIDEQSLGAQHPSVARDLNNLAELLRATNRVVESEPLMRRALAIAEQCFGDEHPKFAIQLNNLAQLLEDTNRFAEAEPLMRRALAIFEKSLGESHPNVAIALNSLAQLLRQTNRLAEAEPLMRRALAISEQAFGDQHPNVAANLSALAQLLEDTNRRAEAEPLMRRALSIDEKSFGDQHPNVATLLNNLAALLWSTNRLAEAEPLMRRALAIDERSFGDKHPSVATALNNLALLLQATNRLAEAEPLMRRALEIDEQSLGRQHPDFARDLNTLAGLFVATNRLAEAEPLARQMIGIFLDFTQHTGHEHPNLKQACANYAVLLQAMGMSESQIRQRLNDLRAEYGMSLS